ncbi:MAG TPA: hypothetical protein VFB99_20455 [Vicinamibacterales bacterium]|nr:hypothetical protein [Vicinamibacterales bacterium]
MDKLKRGQRVRFTRDNLGASLRDELYCVTAERYNIGDEGVVSFPHPNQKPAPMGCKGWWYVEVDSKDVPGEKRYVGVHPMMVAAVAS